MLKQGTLPEKQLLYNAVMQYYGELGGSTGGRHILSVVNELSSILQRSPSKP